MGKFSTTSYTVGLHAESALSQRPAPAAALGILQSIGLKSDVNSRLNIIKLHQQICRPTSRGRGGPVLVGRQMHRQVPARGRPATGSGEPDALGSTIIFVGVSVHVCAIRAP